MNLAHLRNQPAEESVDVTFSIKKSDEVEEMRMVWAEVYAPNVPDSDGEYMTAVEIRKMAYDFLRNGRMNQVDVQHDGNVVDACVVESFIARKDDPTFLEGSWVVGMHVPNDELWDKIKKNEINGFSMEALCCKEQQEVEIEIPPVISGVTTKDDGHEHMFYVTYDQNGRFLGGRTDVVQGHSHDILAGTITQKAEGHCHKFHHLDDVYIVEGDC